MACAYCLKCSPSAHIFKIPEKSNFLCQKMKFNFEYSVSVGVIKLHLSLRSILAAGALSNSMKAS